MPDPFMGWLSYVDQLLIPVAHIVHTLRAISVDVFIILSAILGMWTLAQNPQRGFEVICALCKLPAELWHQSVELHGDLTRVGGIFPLRIDPCANPPSA